MQIKFINDWQYIFKPWAIGGRFASFTFISVNYFRTGLTDLDIDGFGITLLGLGFRIRIKKTP